MPFHTSGWGVNLTRPPLARSFLLPVPMCVTRRVYPMSVMVLSTSVMPNAFLLGGIFGLESGARLLYMVKFSESRQKNLYEIAWKLHVTF